MPYTKCPRCLQQISAKDTIAFDGNRIVHSDCQRPRDLSVEERALLFKFCFDHAVAECAACGGTYRQEELGSDLVRNRTHLCPKCRVDLTESLREHLYACPVLPDNVRLRARSAREAALKLVKESDQLSDRADVLIAEAEAALAALREIMRRATGT